MISLALKVLKTRMQKDVKMQLSLKLCVIPMVIEHTESTVANYIFFGGIGGELCMIPMDIEHIYNQRSLILWSLVECY